MLNLTRRNFLTSSAAALAAYPLASAWGNESKVAKNPMIWGLLLHLGANMWGDSPTAYTPPFDHMTWEDDFWKKVMERTAESGLNMVVIDLGEGVQYESHPEIATKGAWSVEKLRAELSRMRKLGLEPIPKLNFSSCHDFWMGDYARMVSTPTYYRVCADLIKETIEIFDHPRFFHLGYDEETYWHQETYDYVVIRQGELWKHDFLFFIDEVEKNGVRPWIWADYCWRHKDFLEWAPKSIVMSNWYYDEEFDLEKCDPDQSVYVKAFLELDAAGYDQIPTGSNWSHDGNFANLVKYCRDNVGPDRILGYLQSNWHFEHVEPREHIMRSIQLAKEAKEAYY